MKNELRAVQRGDADAVEPPFEKERAVRAKLFVAASLMIAAVPIYPARSETTISNTPRMSEEQYQQQLREAQHGSIKASPPSLPSTPNSRPDITPDDVSEAARGVDAGAEILEAAGLAQEAAGRAIKGDKSIRGPVRNSIGDKRINASKRKVGLGKSVGTAAAIIDSGAKLADGDYGGLAENGIELVIDKVASAWCAQAGPLKSGCEAVYIGGKLAGAGINAGTKALTGTTMRDHVTDIYYKQIYEVPQGPDWQSNYLEERTGVPSGTWKFEEKTGADSSEKKSVMSNTSASNATNANQTCSALSNESSRQSLAQSDFASYLKLWNSCKK